MTEEEQAIEGSLRPRRLAEYIGQEKIKENLSILLEAARRRNESVDHVLLYGPSGTWGKTTLCNIIFRRDGSQYEDHVRPGYRACGRPGLYSHRTAARAKYFSSMRYTASHEPLKNASIRLWRTLRWM